TPDGRYDDYAGADVKGKIVAILFGAPPALPSELGAHLGDWSQKLRLARDHGAVGLITLWSPTAEKVLPWPAVINFASFPQMEWLDKEGQPNDAFPELKVGAVLSASASEGLFQNS